MFSLQLQNDRIYFKDIKIDDLPEILKWYNKVEDFKFATGIDTPISLETLTKKYAEVAISCNEFFAGIYITKEERMIGIIKGSLKYQKKDAVWISSVAVDTLYQNMGYGSLALNMLLGYLKRNAGINCAYLAVIEDNCQGRKFWEKHNFRELRKIKNHLTLQDRKQTVIIMSKEI